ncbi:MAG TPA: hypothetical protein VLA51_14030, partial [Paracoccaceae bacterium]|nr:hypothetical protein [Paracoccaceae bacterium]
MAHTKFPVDQDFEEMARESKEFAENMSQVAEMSQQIWQKFLESNETSKSSNVDPLNTLPAFTELAKT